VKNPGTTPGAAAGPPGVSGEWLAELQAHLGDQVRLGVPLAQLSTYRIGGPARAVVTPRSPEAVATTLRLVREGGVPWFVIGLGSNLLFDDAGFAGVILRVVKEMAHIVQEGAGGTRWTVGAGLPTPRLARRTAAAGYAGIQRLVGVPGAVGGGVFMNAGAHGQDFSGVVQSVDLVTAEGPRRVPGTRVGWGYRTSGLDGVVVAVTLELEPADPARLRRDVTVHLRRRRTGTPFDQPCCGSVFRNPEPSAVEGWTGPSPPTAGRLIEAAGMKGMVVGGARVSPLHANYVVNEGGATSADVRAVIDAVGEAVADRFGVTLRREVRFVSPVG